VPSPEACPQIGGGEDNQKKGGNAAVRKKKGSHSRYLPQMGRVPNTTDLLPSRVALESVEKDETLT